MLLFRFEQGIWGYHRGEDRVSPADEHASLAFATLSVLVVGLDRPVLFETGSYLAATVCRPGQSGIIFMLKRNVKFPAVTALEQSDSISQKFSAAFDYQVHFTERAFALDNPLLEQALVADSSKVTSFICFVDSAVLQNQRQLAAEIERYAEHSSSLELLTQPIPVQGGESCKNDPGLLDELYQLLLDYAVDRHNCILVIGGGAVLDLVGYAAATAHRGIRLLRMPTTVLSQNDSGVGVKNGINFRNRKNFLGTFVPPDAVICDFSLLHTLPERDRRAGMAEAVKVSLIRDARFFDWLEHNRNALVDFAADAVAALIRRSAEIHARQISGGGDPFEKGSNRPLDYGHWLAHKLESLSNYEVRHGEAVAIGMLVDARYACATGALSADALDRIKRLLRHLGFELWHPALSQRDETGDLAILQGLEEFREHLGGELSITLLQEIGVGVEVHEVDLDVMRDSLDWVRDCHETSR
jgi:3-dehydroquinate synthase